MRLWSIHPKYLDAKGIVTCWREGLLAKAVLSNKTRGYKFHPQLLRFHSHPNSLAAINQYLLALYEETLHRNYKFDKRKVGHSRTTIKINVTSGQVHYEMFHLRKKLGKRDHKRHNQLKEITVPELHPLFNLVKGNIERWESKT